MAATGDGISPAPGGPALSIRGVSKRFGEKVVLADLDLEIERGETHVILGQSGTGKSVLLKIITALMPADSGNVLLDGEAIDPRNHDSLERVRDNVQMLFQMGALFDSLTVAQNVAFHAVEHHRIKAAAGDYAEEYLEMVDLKGSGRLMPAELSGGMRKRAALARALAARPRVMLYDEPTTGLDPVTSQVINRLIRETQRRFDVTSVVVTHDLRSAQEVGDRCSFLHEGRILETIEPSRLNQARQPLLRSFAEEAAITFA